MMLSGFLAETKRPCLRTAISIMALALGYFCAGKFGLSLASVNPSASAVWPPSGIALAALLLCGYRLWPGIFLGAFLVNISTQGNLVTTLGIAIGNTLEGLLGAWLVSRFANGAKAFERARNIFKFILLAAILSTVVSATLGVTTLSLGGFARWENYPATWLTWWLGDMVGELIITPLLVIWLTQDIPKVTANQLVEAGGVTLAAVFAGQFLVMDSFAGVEVMAIPPLLWAAFRFGGRGAVTTAFVMSGVALMGTLRGLGPFATLHPDQSLIFLQALMGTLTVTALVLASVVTEQKRVEQRLLVQDAVSRILAESPAIRHASPKIVQVLCETAGWDIGAIWDVDRSANQLTCIEVWHLPSMHVPEFEATTRQCRLTLGVDLPGRVWSSGKPAWIPDVTDDSNFLRAPIASKEGLHAAFGFPIRLGPEMLGVIEFFSREIRELDHHFLQMVGDIGSQLGQFIERKQAETALEQARDKLADANTELERRVQERTAELERANGALLCKMVEEKRLEEQLRQAQKMESIGTLAGGIAHDFNNILNIIKGYGSLLGRIRSADQELVAALKIIDETIDRGACTVQQLLAIAKRSDAKLEPVDLNKMIERLKRLLSETFPKTIDIGSRLDPSLPPVTADPNQIEQALLNICLNARDAMPEHGRLTLMTQIVPGGELRDRFPEAEQMHYALISVVDTGQGMDEDVKSRIFEPFFTTKDQSQGTGLGLAVVYGTVTKHKGFIDVTSQPGQGATFCIYLPIDQKRLAPIDLKSQIDRKVNESTLVDTYTILFVEDEERQLELMQKLLERAGFRVLTATNGVEAVEIHRQHKDEIAAVILDLGLPKLNGWSALQKMKEADPTLKPIVATGYISPEVDLALASGAFSAVIGKPYEFEEILKLISAVIIKTAAPVDSKGQISDHGKNLFVGSDGAHKRTVD